MIRWLPCRAPHRIGTKIRGFPTAPLQYFTAPWGAAAPRLQNTGLIDVKTISLQAWLTILILLYLSYVTRDVEASRRLLCVDFSPPIFWLRRLLLEKTLKETKRVSCNLGKWQAKVVGYVRTLIKRGFLEIPTSPSRKLKLYLSIPSNLSFASLFSKEWQTVTSNGSCHNFTWKCITIVLAIFLLEGAS